MDIYIQVGIQKLVDCFKIYKDKFMRKKKVKDGIEEDGCLIQTFIDGQLFQGRVLRSISEVFLERTKVAEFFSDPDALLSDLQNSFLMFTIDTSKLPLNIQLQIKINIFNKVTGEQVIEEYGKEVGKELFKKMSQLA